MKVDVSNWNFQFAELPAVVDLANEIINDFLSCIQSRSDLFKASENGNGTITFSMSTNDNEGFSESSSCFSKTVHTKDLFFDVIDNYKDSLIDGDEDYIESSLIELTLVRNLLADLVQDMDKALAN